MYECTNESVILYLEEWHFSQSQDKEMRVSKVEFDHDIMRRESFEILKGLSNKCVQSNISREASSVSFSTDVRAAIS